MAAPQGTTVTMVLTNVDAEVLVAWGVLCAESRWSRVLEGDQLMLLRTIRCSVRVWALGESESLCLVFDSHCCVIRSSLALRTFSFGPVQVDFGRETLYF